MQEQVETRNKKMELSLESPQEEPGLPTPECSPRRPVSDVRPSDYKRMKWRCWKDEVCGHCRRSLCRVASTLLGRSHSLLEGGLASTTDGQVRSGLSKLSGRDACCTVASISAGLGRGYMWVPVCLLHYFLCLRCFII